MDHVLTNALSLRELEGIYTRVFTLDRLAFELTFCRYVIPVEKVKVGLTKFLNPPPEVL